MNKVDEQPQKTRTGAKPGSFRRYFGDIQHSEDWTLRRLPLLFFFVLVIAPRPALAYLDPGTGSILLQVVLGGIAGLGVIAKIYWGRIRKLFGLHKSDSIKIDRPPSNDRPDP